MPPLSRDVSIALMVFIALGVLGTASLIQALPRESIVSIERSWRSNGVFREYVSGVYVDGEYVAGIYIRIPRYLSEEGGFDRVLFSLSHVENTSISGLELRFNPPPRGHVILAWIPPSGTMPPCVEFRLEGLGTTWRCMNLGDFGKGTITLEFQPYMVEPRDLSNTIIVVKATILYGSKSIEAVDVVTIPSQ